MECPFCGGIVVGWEEMIWGAWFRISSCCEMPMELIENHEAFKALPATLQQSALEGFRQRREALVAKEREQAKLTAVWYAEAGVRYAHRMKGAANAYPGSE